jgi:hypothetical protein
MLKEIRILNKYRDILCLWIGWYNIIKMSVLPNVIHSYNAIPIKISTHYLTDVDKLILYFRIKLKDPEYPIHYCEVQSCSIVTTQHQHRLQ